MAKHAKVESAKFRKAQKDVKQTHNKEVDKLREERIEKSLHETPWLTRAE